jgi:hypothetical protein
MQSSIRTVRRNFLRALACVALLIVLVPIARAASAQSAVRVNARLNSGVVKLGSTATLSLEVEGTADATLAPLPAVEGLRLSQVGGPVANEAISQLFNGRRTVTRGVTWTIAVQPLKAGEYTIPPITVTADGKEIQTREVTLKAAEDIQGEEFGLFEMDVPRDIIEGQPFTIEMRFGWDTALEQNLNYANLSLPWLGELSGLLELDAPASAPGASAVELMLNSRDRIRAERLPARKVGDRSFTILRVRKRFLATHTGKLGFPTSHIEFGHLPDQTFIFGRPEAKVTYFKRFPAFDIEVAKLPEAGRPIDYSGLVGRVAATANADRRQVDAGDSIKLSIDWTGDGNLDFFQPPDLAHDDAFKDFRVYGSTDRKTFERRTITYDIAPTKPEITEIPSVRLSIYDTDKHAYATIQTQPIPIQVRALKNVSPLGLEAPRSNVVVDIRDIQTGPLLAAQPPRPGSRVILLFAALIVAGWIALRTLVRKSGDPDAPRARARRAAKKQLVRALASAKTASAQSHALSAFLAARTGETSEAWSGRDVIAWAEKARESEATHTLSAQDGETLARTFAQLDERTWAGRDEPLAAAELIAIADGLAKGGL